MTNLDENKTEILEEYEEYEDEDDDDYPRRRFPFIVILLLFFILLLAAVIAGGYYYFTSCQKPVQNESEIVTFEVEENSTILSVANKLEESGLVKDARMTYYFARLK